MLEQTFHIHADTNLAYTFLTAQIRPFFVHGACVCVIPAGQCHRREEQTGRCLGEVYSCEDELKRACP